MTLQMMQLQVKISGEFATGDARSSSGNLPGRVVARIASLLGFTTL